MSQAVGYIGLGIFNLDSKGAFVPRLFCRALAILALVSAGVGIRAAEPPPDAASIRSGVERLIAFLDGPLYRDLASWDEHLVLVYSRLQGRAPSPREAALLGLLRRDIGLARSAVLSYALRGDSATPTWEQCRALLRGLGPEDLVPDASTREEAGRLRVSVQGALAALVEEARIGRNGRESEPVPLSEATGRSFEEFSVYFGYLHAHSALSDGEGDPSEAYAFAQHHGQLDFFALTDHGELLALWPWQDKWRRLVAAAEGAYQPGVFVSLWGFEWSNPLLGHINILNSKDYTGALAHFRLGELYDWIDARPETFAQFNHPGDYNLLGIEFRHLLGYPPVRDQIVGIETWNGNHPFDDYFYSGGYHTRLSYLDEANHLGWFLGALGSQDNHEQDWGVKNDFRTGVLARELTREGIIAAYRNRRFYATEDKDLTLDLRSRGYPMGARLQGTARSFQVRACDGSGDRFREVRLYRNGRLLEARSVDGPCVEESFSDFRRKPAYYYVAVQQTDDNDSNGRPDEAISSPIWYYRSP
jgi:hypothetical protein